MKYAIAGIMFVIVATICFILYIIFNFVLYNPDTGIETILNEKAQDMFNQNNLDKWNYTRANIATGFGISGVVCMGISFALFIAAAFESRRFYKGI